MTVLKLVQSSSLPQAEEVFLPNQNSYDMKSPLEAMVYSYRILANSYKYDSFNQAITSLLDAGIEKLGMETALLTRPVSAHVFEVVACGGACEGFYVGQHLTLQETPCLTVFQGNETCAYTNVERMCGKVPAMAYNQTQVGAYLGTCVQPHFAEPGVMCFTAPEARQTEFSAEDVVFLELLAEGVAFMTDQLRAQAQRKLTDQAMFALGSVKTLDEYLEQARLPEVFGVPARVVEVLQRRIGHAPLSIGHVAEELNLSKRTLQRRLQQQDVNFAELRDQVRFHYSIDYLIKQHQSIDSISASLDFSDRTSFTNAFKRWTGLSPSTFRKLFRDYV